MLINKFILMKKKLGYSINIKNQKSPKNKDIIYIIDKYKLDNKNINIKNIINDKNKKIFIKMKNTLNSYESKTFENTTVNQKVDIKSNIIKQNKSKYKQKILYIKKIESMMKLMKIKNYFTKTFINLIFWNLIIFNFIFPITSQIQNILGLSEITLKIIGKGYQNILNKDFPFIPDNIYLNGNSTTLIDNQIELKNSENIIKLSWSNNQIVSCENMFANLTNIIEIDLSKFDTSSVTNMESMFSNCSSLIKLNLFNLDTRKVENMGYMFSNCTSLISLDLSSFDTSSVQYFYSIFYNCGKLQYLDVSKFKTSSCNNMMQMFFNCELLTSLNLFNFDTSSVTLTNEMFYGCSSLIYLNISSFNTSKVTNMHYMFYNCILLTSLDISNFNTSSVITMYSMFCNCKSLLSLNISSFDTSQVTEIHNMFANCISLISLDLSNFNTSNTNKMDNMFYNCSSLKSLDLSNFDFSKVTIMSKMFYKCKSLEYINLENFVEQNSVDISNIFYNSPTNIVYCINKNNAPKTSEVLETKICSKQDCSKKWNENSIVNEQDKYIYENKCYNKCPSWTYPGKNNTCLICHAKHFFLKQCKINSENREERENLTKHIISEIIDGSLNELLSKVINENIDLKLYEDYEIYQISTLSYQSNNDDNNITSIDFGECINILKQEYDIDEKEELIILKIEYYHNQDSSIPPVIEYDIFSPDGKIKLNLDYCSNMLISYFIPASIEEKDLFKYNITSDYYNDICFPYTTENGTDITLYDRKNEYINGDYILCEYNCTFKGYDNKTKKAECSCEIKTIFKYIFDIDKQKLLDSFINIKSITNIGIIKCNELLFTKDGLIYNIGNYILSVILIITIVLTIIFCINGFNYLFKSIKKVTDIKFKRKKKKSNTICHKLKNKNNKIIHKTNIINNIIIVDKYNPHKDKCKNIKTNDTFKKNVPPKKIRFNIPNSISLFPPNSNNNIIQKYNNESKDIRISDKAKKDDLSYNKLNDFEINSLPYKIALKYDKRTYLQYYFSLVKTKHVIIFTFFLNTDYNSKLIKICLFFLFFALYYIINAFFFNDSTMHQIYKDGGVFNFIYQIPKIIYSSIISFIMKKILTILSLTENTIVKFKNQKIFDKNKIKKTKNIFIIKFILFFIFDYILLIIFWYYISCFCAVYHNTQVYLIKNTLISFSFSLIYPFAIYIIPVCIRIHSLRAKNEDKECIYKLSKIIQLLL